MSQIECKVVAKAFYDANQRRPYSINFDLIAAVTPGGGNWICVAPPGAICRSVKWGRIEVAHVNPGGDLDDTTEGQIAMAIKATPMIDATLRAIIVLAEDPANLPTIRELAMSVVGVIELPAPRIIEDADEESEDEE